MEDVETEINWWYTFYTHLLCVNTIKHYIKLLQSNILICLLKLTSEKCQKVLKNNNHQTLLFFVFYIQIFYKKIDV